MRRIWVVLFIGCNPGDDPDALGDPWAWVTDDDPCEEVPLEDPLPVPGAAGWFVGDFLFAKGKKADDPIEVSGSLQWVLFANQTWRDLGEDDCTIVWMASGLRIPPDNCSACEYTIDLPQLTLDHSLTDCPEGLWEGLEDVYDAYNVDFDEEWKASFYWAASGEYYTDGMANDARAWLVQGPSCNWF